MSLRVRVFALGCVDRKGANQMTLLECHCFPKCSGSQHSQKVHLSTITSNHPGGSADWRAGAEGATSAAVLTTYNIRLYKVSP